jgi:hypothetical protein
LSVIATQPGSNAARRSSELNTQWSAELKRYHDTELPALRAKAEALSDKAGQFEAAAQQSITAGYESHRQGERLDLAELAAELSLVLMSLAVLTKRASFWHAGIVAGVAGVAIVSWTLWLAP